MITLQTEKGKETYEDLSSLLKGHPEIDEACLVYTINVAYEVEEDDGTTFYMGGGEESLSLSMAWHEALDATFPGFRWALAVQDGMDEDMIRRICGAWGWIENVSTIFVGGTMGWKLRTMNQWIMFAHEEGMECHVGRIGTVDRMVMADVLGADSIDSTTWVQRNGSLRDHVEAYRAFMATRKPLEDFA